MRFAPVLLLLLVDPAMAGSFVCEVVDARTPGHSPSIHALEEALGSKPAEVKYCRGATPRWTARWDAFESLDGWRLFATAICFERNDPIECRVIRHAVVPDSHQVIDLPFAIPLPRVIELFEAAGRDYPGFEVARIEYVEVTDGGSWSERSHGYNVYFLEPPDYAGGDIMTYVQRCSEGCRWVTGASSRAGSWDAGSHDRSTRDLQRRRGDPMIDYLDYLGR